MTHALTATPATAERVRLDAGLILGRIGTLSRRDRIAADRSLRAAMVR
jgi:hypothetical protein